MSNSSSNSEIVAFLHYLFNVMAASDVELCKGNVADLRLRDYNPGVNT